MPSLVDLPDPGIEPGSPALQEDSLPTEISGKPNERDIVNQIYFKKAIFLIKKTLFKACFY